MIEHVTRCDIIQKNFDSLTLPSASFLPYEPKFSLFLLLQSDSYKVQITTLKSFQSIGRFNRSTYTEIIYIQKRVSVEPANRNTRLISIALFPNCIAASEGYNKQTQCCEPLNTIRISYQWMKGQLLDRELITGYFMPLHWNESLLNYISSIPFCNYMTASLLL